MRSMYACEKCNKLFEDWDACVKHENDHRSLQISPSDYLVESMSKYDETNDVPAVIFAGYYEAENKPVLFQYKLVKQDSAASAKLIQLTKERVDQNERDAAERQENLAGMLKELDEDNVEIPTDERESYWQISKIYKEKFGKYYAQN